MRQRARELHPMVHAPLGVPRTRELRRRQQPVLVARRNRWGKGRRPFRHIAGGRAANYAVGNAPATSAWAPAASAAPPAPRRLDGLRTWLNRNRKGQR